MKNYQTASLLKFIIPSVIGLLLFVVPLPFNGQFNLGVGILGELLKKGVKDILPLICCILLVSGAVFSVLATLIKPQFVTESRYLSNLLIPNPIWLIGRILGAVFAVITYMVMTAAKGSVFSPVIAAIGDAYIGQVILKDLLPVLFAWFLFAGFLMPILLEFGLMDFFGTLVRKFMLPVFTVPGRSAIDAVTSWIGSGPLGVVVTDRQYNMGYYNGREAAVIATCFSLVSLPFSYVVAEVLKLGDKFVTFYVTIFIASLVAAIIMPRLYPLSRKKNDYQADIGKQIKEVVPEDRSTFDWAVEKAVEKAEKAPGILGLIREGFKIVFDVFWSLMPMVMAIGTIALLIAEKTTVFSTLSAPLVGLLEAVNLPGAEKAAPAMLIGFLDMYLPVIFVKSVEFEITRFVIGALAFTQLIYMTETGTIILRSNIPVNIFDLIVIFLMRTVITFPIILLIAKMVY